MSDLPRLDTPNTLMGVSIDTLLAAVKDAAIQAEILNVKYPESDVVDQVRLDLARLYELVAFEQRVWSRGER